MAVHGHAQSTGAGFVSQRPQLADPGTVGDAVPEAVCQFAVPLELLGDLPVVADLGPSVASHFAGYTERSFTASAIWIYLVDA